MGFRPKKRSEDGQYLWVTFSGCPRFGIVLFRWVLFRWVSAERIDLYVGVHDGFPSFGFGGCPRKSRNFAVGVHKVSVGVHGTFAVGVHGTL